MESFSRRNILKILPFGFVSSILPAKKLFAGTKKDDEYLHYKVGHMDIYEKTYYFTKEELPNGCLHRFAYVDKKSGSIDDLDSYFLDEQGNYIYRSKNVNNNCEEYVPKNAVYPKRKWINEKVLDILKECENRNILLKKKVLFRGKPLFGTVCDKLFVYIYLREDVPCFGMLIDDEEHEKMLCSLKKF